MTERQHELEILLKQKVAECEELKKRNNYYKELLKRIVD